MADEWRVGRHPVCAWTGLTLFACVRSQRRPKPVAPAEKHTRETYQERDGHHRGSARVPQTTSLYTFCVSSARGYGNNQGHNRPYGRHGLSSTDNSPCLRPGHRVLPAMPRYSSCCRAYLPARFIPVAYAPRPWHVTLPCMPTSPLCCRRPFAYPRARVPPAAWHGGEVPPRPAAGRAPRVVGPPAEGVRP
jgi:hypothetical protein